MHEKLTGKQCCGKKQIKFAHEGVYMPMTKKGKKIMESMKKEYGMKKGEKVFYATRSKGTIKGVDKGKKKNKNKKK
jgi:hypothetical protein